MWPILDPEEKPGESAVKKKTIKYENEAQNKQRGGTSLIHESRKKRKEIPFAQTLKEQSNKTKIKEKTWQKIPCEGRSLDQKVT